MQNIGTIIKKIGKSLATFLLLIIALVLFMQLNSPVYDFTKTKKGKFTGELFFNPYQELDSVRFAQEFKKGNFHAHESLNGIPFESMHNYAETEFRELYEAQGYDIILISDHHYINPKSDFGAYESGINFNNFHIGVWGSSDVGWFDFPVMLMPSSQMQRRLNILRDEAEVLVVNHPYSLRNGVDAEDLSGVRGYDLIEMGGVGGGAPWDVPLSEGYYPRLLNTDDSHYPDSVEHSLHNHYTMVRVEEEGSDKSIKRGLLKGWSYGVDIEQGVSLRGEGTEPRLKKVKVVGDTLLVEAVGSVDSVLFIGQGGVVKDRNQGRYVIQNKDTYIRAEIYWSNGMIGWLNPVVRYNGNVEELFGYDKVTVDWLWTIVMWVVWGVLGCGVLVGVLKMWQKKGRRKFRR